MNRYVVVAAVGVAWLASAVLPSSAQAQATDDDNGERALLRTSAHRVTGRQVGRFFEFSVQRRIFNPTTTAQTVAVTWPLPSHGAVTQLRWRRDDDKRWIVGELIRNDEAEAAYQRYLEGDTPQPRGPVLATSDGPTLTLRSPTLAHGRALLIEYRVTSALCYANGSYVAAYPAPAADRDAPALQPPKGAIITTRLPTPLQECVVQQNDITPWRYLIFPNQLNHGIQTQLHRVDPADGGISEFIVAVGRQLEAAPRHASVVFVIDASRSVAANAVAEQLKIAKDFLRHLPDASFNIIFARRKATPLWSRMQPAGTASKLSKLPEAVTQLGNGSNFDAALQLAATMLGNVPGPHYLIAFTDAQWRKTLRAEHLPARLVGLPATAVLHIVTIPRNVGADLKIKQGDKNVVDQEWNFNPDCDPLAKAFEQRWRGMIVMLQQARCSGGPDDIDRSAQPPLSAQMVRPMLIEKLTLDGEPFATEVLEGHAEHTLSATPGAKLRTLRGTIWGRAWSQSRMDDAFATRHFAAVAHTTALSTTMTPTQAEQVAVHGHAISPSTSMLAIDRRFGPGAIAAGTGLSIASSSSSWFDDCCHDNGDLVGFATVKGVGPTLQNLLYAAATTCASTHHLVTWQATVQLELTGLEIVAVNTHSPAGVAFETCVTERIWTVWAVNPNDLTEVSAELKNLP